jgi:hypothetical protein
MSKRLGRRRRRAGKGARPRSLRFAYTLKAFGAMTFLIAAAFTFIHVRQMQSVREEVLTHARSVAQGLAMPASDLLSRPEPMSIEQTLLNQSIRAALKSNPEYVMARVLDTTGRVWGSNRFEELFTTERSGLRHGSGAGLGGLWAPPAYTVSGGVGTIVEPVLAGTIGKPRVVLGYVQIGISEHAIESRIGAARAELAGIALLTLFLGCVLSVILIGIFVRPIQVLSDSVRAIGEGTMVAEVGGSGNEEIDEIARAFNEITAKFRAAQGNLVEQERLQKEMQVAQEIQQSLLPRHVPRSRATRSGRSAGRVRRSEATTTTSSRWTTAPWAWWSRTFPARASPALWS